MSRPTRLGGNQGLARSAEQVPAALQQCIDAIRPLSHPARTRVVRGLSVWVLESVAPAEGTAEEE
jgi:hypothetical protein